jgi:O-antigen/teichoic acid export membrane protein
MNLAQKVAVNTSAQIGSMVIGVFVSLVTLRITTGYLGVHQYGELAIILTVAGVIVAISDLGIATTLARDVVKSPEDVDRIAGHLLTFRLVSTAVLTVGTLAIVPVLPYTTQTKLALALYLVGVTGWTLASFPSAFFQVHLKLHLQAAIDMSTRIVALVGVSVVALLDLGFYALVAALGVVGVMSMILAFWFIRRFWRPVLRWERGYGLPLVRNTLAIGVVAMIGILHFRSDGVLLSLLAPARDVGIYSIAYRFIDQSISLAAPFALAIFPILTRFLHEGPGRADTAINRSFQVLALGSAAISLAMLSLAHTLVHLIAGPGFEAAAEPTRILAFAVPFLFCSLLFYNVGIAAGHQRTLIHVGLCSLALNILLNLFLIPRLTYNGAAITAVISHAVGFFGTYWVARRAVGFRFEVGFLVRLVIATASAGLVCAIFVRRSEFAAFILAELVLVGMAYLAGAVRVADIRLVLNRDRRPREV